MKHYFSIQLKRLIRFFEKRGFSLGLAVALILVLFVGGTYFLHQKTPYAAWIIFGIVVTVLFPLSSRTRYDHLQLIFKSTEVFKVRLLENLLISIPFLICMGSLNWVVAVITFVPITVLAFKIRHRILPFSLPTPFQKIPVHFPSGFRKYFFLHLFTIPLAVFAISIENYNLGLFAIILNWLFVFGYFGKVEPLEYVWIHSKTPKQFLMTKIKEGILGSSFIIVPIALVFIAVDFSVWYFPVVIYLLGLINLINLILASYISFPDEMSLPNGILIAITFMLPPLALIGLGYFYTKASQNLKLILNDSDK
ncbi:hypothetical protein [Parvicella tangerina]|uniref:Uncharacterized protein n=1 Tax=Parvicella tangerina TaxID=2829795 RepID=A0A916NQJ4_9FLAO|nr:hypothetical protein [Parvicella tangerina]CAG5079200.1 hypothetical protein CRYO30217_00885 [Parvicella tangerina]